MDSSSSDEEYKPTNEIKDDEVQDDLPKVYETDTTLNNSDLKTRYRACMILSGVGDALGYKNGIWEFCFHGEEIFKDVKRLGGIENIHVNSHSFRLSDDTIMHIATAEALIKSKTLEELFPNFADRYIASFKDMGGRAPGGTTGGSIWSLQKGTKWNEISFNRSGGGCGASMRSACIGLRYFGENRRKELIAASIESGRITHNHISFLILLLLLFVSFIFNPIGFLGSFAASALTAFAVEGIPPVQWGRKVLKLLPACYAYLKEVGRDWQAMQEDLMNFEKYWTDFLKLRDIYDEGKDFPQYPLRFGVKERDEYYKSISFRGWGGASGHDSVIIAYDAILGSEGDWIEFCARGVLHGGDNDSTGAIGGAAFGAYYGFKGVPLKHYKDLEYKSRLLDLADKLFELREEKTNANSKSVSE